MTLRYLKVSLCFLLFRKKKKVVLIENHKGNNDFGIVLTSNLLLMLSDFLNCGCGLRLLFSFVPWKNVFKKSCQSCVGSYPVLTGKSFPA